MEEKRKVNVRIYGQDYKIAGDASKEYILSLASYVDTKMNEVVGKGQCSAQMLAVLAAINITDEFFKTSQELKSNRVKMDRYSIELKNKDNHLRELKNSYLQYKQDKEKDTGNINEIKNELKEKSNQYELLKSDFELSKNENEALKKEIEKLKNDSAVHNSIVEEQDKEIKELIESKQELENIYFDTEMMNVQLKKELEDLHKIVE